MKDIIAPAVKIEKEVLFAFDSSELKPSYYSSLNETAKLMQSMDQDKESLWQVVGYADATGKHVYNIKLAKRRAQTVAQYLVDKGVSEERLSIVSLGDSNALSEPLHQVVNLMERRVEIHAYKAEITALAEQLNKQQDKLNRDKLDNKITKEALQEVVSIEEHIIKSDQINNTLPADFALPQKNTITTAMDL